jgi:ABC-type transport system involved in multi-copper enzyme maturation permease subunit
MIIAISNEFSFKTHRQNVIDGLSRTQFIVTKMMIATILAIISTIVVFITALLFGLGEKASEFSTTGMNYVFYFFIQALSYTMVSLLFGLFFRRSGIAIGVYFLYILVLENLIAGLLNKYANHVGTYLPLETTDGLIPFPFFRNITSQFYYEPNFTVLMVLSVVYLIAYVIVGKRKFETADL